MGKNLDSKIGNFESFLTALIFVSFITCPVLSVWVLWDSNNDLLPKVLGTDAIVLIFSLCLFYILYANKSKK